MPLNPEQVEKVKHTLNSSGWNDVIRPAILTRTHEMTRALVLSPSERDGEWKGIVDDDLRARIRAAAWLLESLEMNVKVHDYNRRLDELARAEANVPNPTGEPGAEGALR